VSTFDEEYWTEDHERFMHVAYTRDVAEVSREVLHELLRRAGFTQARLPSVTDQTPSREVARDRLRRASDTVRAATTEETK
jgi:hypothetical protein